MTPCYANHVSLQSISLTLVFIDCYDNLNLKKSGELQEMCSSERKNDTDSEVVFSMKYWLSTVY